MRDAMGLGLHGAIHADVSHDMGGMLRFWHETAPFMILL